MPTAAISSGHTSWTDVHGTVGLGNPLGKVPTVLILSDSPRTAEITVAPTTATSTAGTFRVILGSTSSTTSTPTPTASAAPFVLSRLSTKATTSPPKELASVEYPNSFGSWPTTIVIARPFMYPTCTS